MGPSHIQGQENFIPKECAYNAQWKFCFDSVFPMCLLMAAMKVTVCFVREGQEKERERTAIGYSP